VIENTRDRALFSLVYLYGLRVSEVGLLNRDDVDLERGRIVVKRVKGGLWSERPLFKSCASALSKYLSERCDSLRPLFPGRGGPLQKRQIQSLFVRYRDRARLSKRHTTHGLRHSVATHLLEADMPLEFVQDHLGHRNIKSTTVYARITSRYRAAQFRRLEVSPWLVHPGQEIEKRKESSCEQFLVAESGEEYRSSR
jgi:site-specific recombinase XerC